MESGLRLVALPRSDVAVVEVRILVGSPIVEHAYAHLHAQVLQRLVAHGRLQSVARQRVSLREVALVLVVAEEAECVEVETQFAAGSRVDAVVCLEQQRVDTCTGLRSGVCISQQSESQSRES